jgi:hypothetical protein
MARIGLTKSQVREIRTRLLADGVYPSADAVRHALGDTGSKSTIHRYLKELAGEGAAEAIERDDTARALHALVEQLADRLHADAGNHQRLVRAGQDEEVERLLREKDSELVVLRDTVARLTARIDMLEAHTPPTPAQGRNVPAKIPSNLRTGMPASSPSKAGAPVEGFGDFGGLAGSRCAGRDNTAFSIILGGGRSAVDDVESVRPSGLKFS